MCDVCVFSSANCPEALDIRLSRSREGTQGLSAQVGLYLRTYVGHG